MKKYKKIFVVISSLFFVVSFSGCDQIIAVKDAVVEYFKGGSSPTKEKAVQAQQQNKETKQMTPDTLAMVGNWSITKDEFNDRLTAIKEIAPNFNVSDKEAKKMILDELINQQVFVEEAEKTGLTKDKDILSAIEEFKRTLIVREMARRQVQNLTVTDQEEESFYNENKDSITAPYDYRVGEIVVDTKEKAQEILSQLKSGEDFASLAKKHSISKSAENGGELGFITEEPFPEMANAIVQLDEGQVSDIFKGPEGFYIIKLEEKKGGEPLTLDEVKEDLKQNLLMMKQKQAIVDYLEQLKEKYKIEKNESLL